MRTSLTVIIRPMISKVYRQKQQRPGEISFAWSANVGMMKSNGYNAPTPSKLRFNMIHCFNLQCSSPRIFMVCTFDTVCGFFLSLCLSHILSFTLTLSLSISLAHSSPMSTANMLCAKKKQPPKQKIQNICQRFFDTRSRFFLHLYDCALTYVSIVL